MLTASVLLFERPLSNLVFCSALQDLVPIPFCCPLCFLSNHIFASSRLSKTSHSTSTNLVLCFFKISLIFFEYGGNNSGLSRSLRALTLLLPSRTTYSDLSLKTAKSSIGLNQFSAISSNRAIVFCSLIMCSMIDASLSIGFGSLGFL